MKSLFVFHRDLRLEDNTALNKALSVSSEVFPVFVFDIRQIRKENNPYFTDNGFHFFANSLNELADNIEALGSELLFLRDTPEIAIVDSAKALGCDSVFMNKDYTPFSIKREEAIKRACEIEGLQFFSFDDNLLTNPLTFKNSKGLPPKVFTKFFKKQSKFIPEQPNTEKNLKSTLAKAGFGKKAPYRTQVNRFFLKSISPKENRLLGEMPGRKEGLKALSACVLTLKGYSFSRDFFNKLTSRLSAHLKFGTISIREVYWFFKKMLPAEKGILKELYWRDFFYLTALHSPRVFGHAFREKYDNLEWTGSNDNFVAWKEGKTGFPIVDACMRQLNSTGYMSNRGRMITASFLVKNLHVDWKKGEKYFATKLVDYDPCINNGNWQWVAGTGCDAQPFFRIFNPWTQQKKFDAETTFIKKWIPELNQLTSKDIHNWTESSKRKEIKTGMLGKPTGQEISLSKKINYPEPIINAQQEAKKAQELYKKVTGPSHKKIKEEKTKQKRLAREKKLLGK
jgi:deoxyribodipyrimidine photo-lyase